MPTHDIRRWTPLLLAAVIAAGGWRAATSAQDESAEPAEPTTQVIESAEDAPRISQRLIERALKDLPEDHRLQITIDHFFDRGHSTSTMDREPFVASFVPVDKKGRPNGEQRFHEPRSARPYRTVTWKEGEKTGPERQYTGSPPYLAAEIPWVDGVVHGVRKQFSSNGTVTSELTYEQGVIVGTAKSYNREGKLTRQVPYQDGEMHGKRIDYWPQTGEPRRIVPYVEGQSHGEVIEYHQNGKVKRRTHVREGQLHGPDHLFNDRGDLIEKRYWLDGSLVSEEAFRAAQAKSGSDDK